MPYTLRRGINFIRNLEKYYQKEKPFVYFRYFTIVFTFTTIVLSLYFIFLNLSLSLKIRSLINQKKEILEVFLTRYSETEQISVITDKLKFILNTLEKEDTRFPVYYKKINQLISTDSAKNDSTQEANAKIEKFSLDKNKEVEFTITVQGTDNFVQLLNNIDNEDFYQSFEYLELINLNLTKGEETNLYILKFKGRFKKLTDIL